MANKFLNRAYETKVGNPTAKAVLVALANHSDNDGIAWASVGRLSQHTEFCERAVIGAIDRLQALSLLAITQPGNGRRATTYQLTLPVKQDAADPEPESTSDTISPEPVGVQQMHPSEPQGVHDMHPRDAADAPQGCTTCTPGVQQMHPIHTNPPFIPESSPATAVAKPASDALVLCSDPEPAEKKKGAEKAAKPPKEPRRDEAFEALCEAQGSHWEGLAGSERGRLNKALQSIRSGRPGVTGAEILAAAAEFRSRWPRVTCSATAIAAHWSSLFTAAKKEPTPKPPVPVGPEGYLPVLLDLYPRAKVTAWADLPADMQAEIREELRKKEGGQAA